MDKDNLVPRPPGLPRSPAPWDQPIPEKSDMPSDAPFCDVCGHITVKNGSGFKCLNCGNSMAAGQTKPFVPFFFCGQGGEKIGVEINTDSISFYAPSGKDDPEIGRELNLISAWIEYLKQKGVKYETTCLKMPEGDRPDRVRILIGMSPKDKRSLKEVAGLLAALCSNGSE